MHKRIETYRAEAIRKLARTGKLLGAIAERLGGTISDLSLVSDYDMAQDAADDGRVAVIRSLQDCASAIDALKAAESSLTGIIDLDCTHAETV